VIAVFTKYELLRREIEMHLEDQNRDLALLDVEVERTFQEHCLARFTEPPPSIRLESENFVINYHGLY
jgi:hypothetical protein